MSSLETQKYSGVLTVNVIGGRDLKDCELFGKMSPFATLAYGRAKFKTKVHANGGFTPIWKQAFEFKVEKRLLTQEKLHINVYDKDVLTDDFVGRLDMSFAQLIVETKSPTWLDIVEKDNPAIKCGMILLQTTFQSPTFNPNEQHTLASNQQKQTATAPHPVLMEVKQPTAPHPLQQQQQQVQQQPRRVQAVQMPTPSAQPIVNNLGSPPTQPMLQPQQYQQPQYQQPQLQQQYQFQQQQQQQQMYQQPPMRQPQPMVYVQPPRVVQPQQQQRSMYPQQQQQQRHHVQQTMMSRPMPQQQQQQSNMMNMQQIQMQQAMNMAMNLANNMQSGFGGNVNVTVSTTRQQALAYRGPVAPVAVFNNNPMQQQQQQMNQNMMFGGQRR